MKWPSAFRQLSHWAIRFCNFQFAGVQRHHSPYLGARCGQQLLAHSSLAFGKPAVLGGENDIRSSFRVWCCFCPWAFGIGSEFLMLAPSQENSTGTMGCQSCSWKSAWLSFCAFHAFFWLPQLTWVIRTSTSNSCQWLGQAIPRDSPCRSGINPLLWASSSAKPRRPVELGYIPVRACSFNFPVV